MFAEIWPLVSEVLDPLVTDDDDDENCDNYNNKKYNNY